MDMNMRRLRNRFAPWLSRQGLLALVNPLAQRAMSARFVERRLSRLLELHRIEYLDLGGWAAVEGYLTVHLSPVEIYGQPTVPRETLRQRFRGDDGDCMLERDSLTAPAVLLNFDLRDGLPLADRSMAGVNMSHFLEHFPLDQGETIVAECHRALRDGGVLRISCPDLEKYARAYVAGDDAFFESVSGPAFCRYENLQTRGDRFISKAYDNDGGHKWFYDVGSVSRLLRRAGFAAIRQCGVHESGLPRIHAIEPAYRARESFYLEAVR
jgi:predicted SAM-dependent methyltransferase